MIRKLSIIDYDDVVKLWKSAGLLIRERGRDHRKNIQAQLKSENVAILGKRMNGQLIGVVLVSHDHRKGWINRLAVHPLNRRKGIANELLNAAEKYLKRERGIEIFGALIFSDNSASIQLFETNNYERWEEVQYFTKRMRTDS